MLKNLLPPKTKTIRTIVIACAIVEVIQLVCFNLGVEIYGFSLNEIFGLVPRMVVDRFWLWQFFTHIFMNGHPLYFLGNMLWLWLFGARVEAQMGHQRFFFYFLMCGIGAGIVGFVAKWSSQGDAVHPIMGTSGAVFGVLGAYCIMFGRQNLLALSFIFVTTLVEFWLAFLGADDHAAHYGHLAGMLTGVICLFTTRRAFKREKSGPTLSP